MSFLPLWVFEGKFFSCVGLLEFEQWEELLKVGQVAADQTDGAPSIVVYLLLRY